MATYFLEKGEDLHQHNDVWIAKLRKETGFLFWKKVEYKTYYSEFGMDWCDADCSKTEKLPPDVSYWLNNRIRIRRIKEKLGDEEFE